MKYSFATILLGVLVLIGWAGNVTLLTNVDSSWVSMKPVTALLFVMCGFLGIVTKQFHDWCHPLCVVVMFVALYTFGSQLEGSAINPFSERQELFSVNSGIPSLVTLFSFSAYVLDCWMVVSSMRSGREMLQARRLLMCIGGLGVIGYLINFPVLYYYLPGVSSAMAIHTCAGVFLLGMSCHEKDRETWPATQRS